MTTTIQVQAINDEYYSHSALVLVDGDRLPMGQGMGKGQSIDAAVHIAASNAGVADYEVEISK